MTLNLLESKFVVIWWLQFQTFFLFFYNIYVAYIVTICIIEGNTITMKKLADGQIVYPILSNDGDEAELYDRLSKDRQSQQI